MQQLAILTQDFNRLFVCSSRPPTAAGVGTTSTTGADTTTGMSDAAGAAATGSTTAMAGVGIGIGVGVRAIDRFARCAVSRCWCTAVSQAAGFLW